MRIPLLLCLSVLASLTLRAQDPLPRAEAVRFAALLNLDLEKLKDTPIPTDADVKRPFGIRADKRGGLLVPEAKLSIQTLAKAAKEIVPVGQLWLAGVVPQRGSEAVPKSELKLVTVEHEGREVTLPLCVLGVRRTEAGELELLVFGKGRDPLLKLPLKKLASGPREAAAPLEFTAERAAEGAKITLLVVGAFEATFEVTAPAE